MENTARASKRKVIDIKPNTFRTLSIMAASRGTNLKHFIESCLDELVDIYEDTTLYEHLRQTGPEGLKMANEEEKAIFLKEQGL